MQTHKPSHLSTSWLPHVHGAPDTCGCLTVFFVVFVLRWFLWWPGSWQRCSPESWAGPRTASGCRSQTPMWRIRRWHSSKSCRVSCRAKTSKDPGTPPAPEPDTDTAYCTLPQTVGNPDWREGAAVQKLNIWDKRVEVCRCIPCSVVMPTPFWEVSMFKFQ